MRQKARTWGPSCPHPMESDGPTLPSEVIRLPVCEALAHSRGPVSRWAWHTAWVGPACRPAGCEDNEERQFQKRNTFETLPPAMIYRVAPSILSDSEEEGYPQKVSIIPWTSPPLPRGVPALGDSLSEREKIRTFKHLEVPTPGQQLSSCHRTACHGYP